MALRERILGRPVIGLSGVVAATLCASLVFAASASAKAVLYYAPVPAPPGNSSSIEFKVKFKKKPGTNKFRPVAIKKVWVYSLISECPDGPGIQASFKFPDPIPVSNRKFSLTADYYENGSTFEFSGRFPRNGPAKGQIRLAFPPDPPQQPAACNSGSLSWTAKVLDEAETY